MWAFGDYPGLVTDLITPLGTAQVTAAEVRPGDRVLDVAAGSGNAAIPAGHEDSSGGGCHHRRRRPCERP
jgi:hypothetical protein